MRFLVRIVEKLVAAMRAHAAVHCVDTDTIEVDEAMLGRVVGTVLDEAAVGTLVESVPRRKVPTEKPREERGRREKDHGRSKVDIMPPRDLIHV